MGDIRASAGERRDRGPDRCSLEAIIAFRTFHSYALRRHLEIGRIAYLHMGDTLGGQPNSGGPADYEQMARAPEFQHGLDRVQGLASRSLVCLMCSEHEPLGCHRCLLVGRRLSERGVSVEHILHDGRMEPHGETEDRLLELTHQGDGDFFALREQRLENAYQEQNARLWAPRTRQPAIRE